MRIFKLGLLAGALVSMLAMSGSGTGAAPARTPEAAYRASVAAMKAHDFGAALPDLKFAADHGVFLAQYYLAQLYSVDGQPFTDHSTAFGLLRELVAANRNLDPYIDKRAPFIANAERILALYYRRGLPEAGISADPVAARAHLEHAALRLGDTESQFQLALLDLQSPELAARGLDTLDMLAETKHNAAAAAQIALVYDGGQLHTRVPAEALGYATLALKLAGENDKIWIADIYQSLYCKTGSTDRAKAAQFASELEGGSGLDVTDGDQGTDPARAHGRVQGVLDLGGASTLRVCGNGDEVPEPAGVSVPAGSSAAISGLPQTGANGFNSAVGFINPPMGIGLKDLETPTAGDDRGEPGAGDQPTQ